MSIVDWVCGNMREEFVVGDWQLLSLETSQWKELGVPMGLSTAIWQLSLDAVTSNGTSSTSNIQISSDLNRNYQTSLLTSNSLSTSKSRKDLLSDPTSRSMNKASLAHWEHNLFPKDDDN
jgi:hypothetical protein